MKKAMRDERGAALVLTLVLLLIGGLIITPLLGFMGTGHLAGQVHEKRMDELYAADAGIEDAIWRMRTGAVEPPTACHDPEVWEYTISVEGQDVTVLIEYVENDKFKVTSETNGAESSTRVESYVFYGSQWDDILNFGVIALNGDISIGPTDLDSYPVQNEARIYANGNINMVNQTVIHGDAYATGAVVGGKIDGIKGETHEGIDEIKFLFPDLAVYRGEALRGQRFEDLPGGALSIVNSRSLGPAYIDGNLTIASHAVVTLGGPVWVTGYVSVDGGSRILGEAPLLAGGIVTMRGSAGQGTEKMPVIISTATSDIDDTEDYAIWFSGSDEAFMVLYAPEGRIIVSGSADVNGALIGRTVRIDSAKCNAIYDMNVVDRLRAKRIRVLTWEVEVQ